MFRIDADYEMAIMNFQILIFHQFLSIIVLYIYGICAYVYACVYVLVCSLMCVYYPWRNVS